MVLPVWLRDAGDYRPTRAAELRAASHLIAGSRSSRALSARADMARIGGIFLLVFGVLLSGGCSAQRATEQPQVNSTTLENVQWTLLQLDGEAVKSNARGAPTLSLASKDRRLSGFAGCNRMIGGYELDGEAVKFTGMDSSLRMPAQILTSHGGIRDSTHSRVVSARTC